MRSLRWFADSAAFVALLIGLATPAWSRAQQSDPPPKIQELMKKSRAGEKLTDAEQSALIEWYSAQSKAQMRNQLDAMRAKQPASRSAPADSSRFVMPGNSQDDDERRAKIGLVELKTDDRGCPAAPTSAALKLGMLPPSAARLRALLDSISRDMLYLEGDETAPTLRRIVQKTPDAKTIAGMAGSLWLAGTDYASAYMYAESAKQNATARTLANLGAALNGIGDARRAALVLRAADAITPGFPPILTNLGVAYARLGDLMAAETALRTAARAWPEFAEAQTGLGRVLRCEGKLVEASLAMQAGVSSSPTARRQRVAESVEKEADQTKSSGNESSVTEFPDRPPQPMRVITLGSARSADVSMTFIPLGGSLAEYVGRLPAAIKTAQRVVNDAGVVSDQAKALENAALRVLYRPPQRTPNGIVLFASDANAWAGLQARSHKAEVEAGRSDSSFSADADHALARLRSIAGTIDMSDPKHIREINCAKNMAAANEAYAQAHAAYTAMIAGVNKAMQSYARDAAEWIGQMNEPAVVEAAGARVAATIASRDAQVVTEAGFLAEASVWVSACAKPQEKDADAKPGKKPDKPEPKDCPPFFSRNIGVLSVTLTCRTFEIGGGEGFIGKLKYDVVSKAGTVFLGAGFASPKSFDAAEGSKVVEQVNKQVAKAAPWVEGKIGIVVGFDGNGLSDGGFSYGLKAGAGGKEIDFSTQMTIVNGMTQGDGFSSAFGPTSSGISRPGSRGQ